MNKIHKSIVLSICIYVLLIFSAPYVCIGAESDIVDITVSSPSGNIKIYVNAENGQIGYSVTYEGRTLLNVSQLGVVLSGADFTNGAEIINVRDNVINETYTMKSGKAEQYINRANEKIVTICKDGHFLDIYFRAYDDGVAYRYGFTESTQAIGEKAVFDFGNADYTAYYAEYEMCYESLYKVNSLSNLYGAYCMPMTIDTRGCYVSITEAALNGSYTGSVINSNGGSSLSISYEPKQTEPVQIEASICSPWRAAVIGDLNTIAMTQIPENLSEPSKIADDSWIKPGITSWTWFNGDPTNDPETYKKYIDFSAEMGWEYVLLDEGWQPMDYDEMGRKTYNGLESWAEDVISYANTKNIGVIVWAASWDLDTADKRTRMMQWADLGISGIKVDFFNSETQNTLKLMDEITEYAASLKLLVNYHGCTKPSGLRRTWQNLITCEAVYGNEHFLSGENWGPTAQHNCILPFTRNAIGPMDYTPELTNYCDKNFFSDGQKAALPIVFESGIQCLSDKPEIYRSSLLYEFLKNLPAAWDESRILSGEIGNSVTVMRRDGDIYYVGSICNNSQSTDVQLDFLKDGRYRFEMYSDGKTDTELVKYTGIVQNSDYITIPKSEHGGGVIKLIPLVKGESEFTDISGHWCEKNIIELSSSNKLNKYFYSEFKPDQYITRGEFVMLMNDALGIDADFSASVFCDTEMSVAKNYIAGAFNKGIINGISDGIFGIDEKITREDAATIIGRYLNLSGGQTLSFSDSYDISDYAKEYVAQCSAYGIVNGYKDGSFRPKDSITRAESAAILRRSIK